MPQQHNAKRKKRPELLTKTALTLFCLVVNAYGLTVETAGSALTGLGYRNQTSSAGSVPSSMLGGAEVMLKGQGYAEMAPSNSPWYTFGSNLSNLKVAGPAISGKLFVIFLFCLALFLNFLIVF